MDGKIITSQEREEQHQNNAQMVRRSQGKEREEAKMIRTMKKREEEEVKDQTAKVLKRKRERMRMKMMTEPNQKPRQMIS